MTNLETLRKYTLEQANRYQKQTCDKSHWVPFSRYKNLEGQYEDMRMAYNSLRKALSLLNRALAENANYEPEGK